MGIVVTSHPFLWVLLGTYLLWIFWVFWQEGFGFALLNLLILSLPFNNTISIPQLGVSLPTVLVIIVGLMGFLNLRRFLGRIKALRLEYLFAIELLCLGIILLVSLMLIFRSGFTGIRGFVVIAGWAILFLLPLCFVYTDKRLKLIYATLLFSVVSIVFVSLLQQLFILPFVESIYAERRILGSLRTLGVLFGVPYRSAMFGFANAGEYGIWSITSIVIILFSLKYKLIKSRLLQLGLLVALILLLIVAGTLQSRSTWLATFIVLLYFLFMSLPFPHLLRFVLAPITLVGFTIVLYLLLALGFIERIFAIRPLTIIERIESYKLAEKAFLEHPYIGAGVRQVQFFSPIVGHKIEIHNTVLSYLVSVGLIGTVPVLLLLGLIMFLTINMRKKSRKLNSPLHQMISDVCIGILLAVIIEGMFFPGSHNKVIGFTLGLVNASNVLILSAYLLNIIGGRYPDRDTGKPVQPLDLKQENVLKGGF